MGATNDFNRFSQVDNLTQDWLFSVGDAVSVGDLMFDSGSDVARPADKQAAQTSAALAQQLFASKFVGVSQQQVLSTETNALKRITLRTDAVCEFACPSQTWNKGDLVGIYSAGTVCDPQQVNLVTSLNLAVGIVTKSYLTATTRVRVRVMSRKTDAYYDSVPNATLGSLQPAAATNLLADANATLTVGMAPMQKMVPTAARNVTLPLESASKGLWYWIYNASGGAFSLTVLASGGGAAAGNNVVPQNKVGVAYCDGTTWVVMVGA